MTAALPVLIGPEWHRVFSGPNLLRLVQPEVTAPGAFRVVPGLRQNGIIWVIVIRN